MADNPITTPLPADLPTNWTYGQTVAPTGAEVGLTQQHGYNYLMEQVNAAQNAANTLGAAFEGVPSTEAMQEALGGYIPMNQKGTANGVAALDASGQVSIAQLPFDMLIRYLSPDGVDAPDRGSQDNPLRSLSYAVTNFAAPGRMLTLMLAPGGYGYLGISIGRCVTINAIDPVNKPILTSTIEVGYGETLSLNNCKISGSLSDGNTHIKNLGTLIVKNVDFECTGGTGNASAIVVNAGIASVSNCTFNGYRQGVFLGFGGCPAFLVATNNTGANPGAYSGIFRAEAGVIMWRKGTQPTGAGGTTTVVTVNGGQVYGE